MTIMTRSPHWARFGPVADILDGLSLDECVFVAAAVLAYLTLRIDGRWTPQQYGPSVKQETRR